MSTTALHAENAGVRIAYDVLGDGEPLLMIHGLGYGRLGWGGADALLAEDFRVVRLDNRGMGDSDVPSAPFGVREMARDALEVLDAAEIDRAHVLGTSLGGMIAQELVLAAPERVEKLVLVCTHPGGDGSYPLPERTQRLLAEFPTLPPADALLRAVKNSLADAVAETRTDLVEEIYAYRTANPPPLPGWQAQVAAGSAHDALDRLSEIDAPTLVVTGTADNVIDYRNSELIAERIPNARLELFDGAGHLFFWEEPERFAAVVKEFLC